MLITALSGPACGGGAATAIRIGAIRIGPPPCDVTASVGAAIVDGNGQPIQATARLFLADGSERIVRTDERGQLSLRLDQQSIVRVVIEAPGFTSQELPLVEQCATGDLTYVHLEATPEEPPPPTEAVPGDPPEQAVEVPQDPIPREPHEYIRIGPPIGPEIGPRNRKP